MKTERLKKINWELLKVQFHEYGYKLREAVYKKDKEKISRYEEEFGIRSNEICRRIELDTKKMRESGNFFPRSACNLYTNIEEKQK